MKSLSVKGALSGLFAIMILIVGGLAYLALNSINGINQHVEDFGRNHLPTTDLLGRINASTGDFRYLEGEHLLSDALPEKTDKEKELSNLEQQYKAASADYTRLDNTDQERRLFDAFQAKWASYMQLHRRMIELSRANKNEEGAALYKGEMGTLYDETNEIIDKLLSLNRESARAAVETSDADYQTIRLEIYIVAGIALAIGLVAMAFSWLSISGPISRITASMVDLAKGNTSTQIPFGDRTNEIGQMAGAVQVFKDNMIRARELDAEASDAKARAETERKRQMNAMADQFERSVGGIVRIVSDAASELQAAAQTLSSSSSQTTHQSTVVAAASEEAAANVRTVAAAAEELSGSVREISRQVSESATIARKAVSEAELTNAQVSGLSEGAQKIGAIVDLINDIASKTNLLALNATIEAARAGEAGRGFAVVASEVKALAEQTSKATAEITAHIGGVQTSTDQAAHAILGIGKIIDDINHIASTIAAAVEEQGAATEEIARNVDQAAQGTTEVTRNIAGVNQAAESSAASASEVLSSAGELASQSDRLRKEVENFLATVRAA